MKTTATLVLSLSLSLALAGGTLVANDATVKPLLSKDLASAPGKELTMITVEYKPGGTDPVHTHNAQAMVYVLEGSIVMQVKGGPPVTLGPGQTFYEGPNDVHIVRRPQHEHHGAREVRGVTGEGQRRTDSHTRQLTGANIDLELSDLEMVRPARLDRATSWFVQPTLGGCG